MTYALFQTRMAQVNDLLSVLNLLAWDARTQMPPGGIVTRGNQVATLTSLARDLATGEDMKAAIASAREEVERSGDATARRALQQAELEIGTLSRIPAKIVAEMAELKTLAHSAWVDARARNDFTAYAPILERMFAMQREIAEAIGYEEHPYDAMLGLYEPGMTLKQLHGVLEPLKAALVPLIDKATSAPRPRMDFLSRSFPVAAQKAFGMKMAEKFGYDLQRGRLDDTVHPFEISFTRNDVRITSRFRETWLPGGMFALWHEAGHGMYEQGAAPEITRTIFATDVVNLYAVAGASFGMHESQSRLWENRVGRSRRFWELHFGELRDAFPEQLSDVTPEMFWQSVNTVRPDFIRVEADELTYDLHIILRTEIESAMMAGEAKVADLPAMWNERMKRYLGRDVPTDTLGVLQDVHWSHGYVGSFPTYTVGNIMGAQFFDAAVTQQDIATGLDQGDYAPLKNWLTENIYRHGRASSPAETLERVIGGPLDIAPYVRQLTEKVAALTA